VDDLCPVALKPPSVIVGALEPFIGYIGSPGSQAHTDEPRIRAGSCGKEAFRQLLIGGRSSPKAEARYDPARVDGGEQAETFVPSQAVGPSDVGLSGHPSMPPTLAVPDGHRRAIESLVRVLSCLQKSRQMQEESLDKFCARSHEAVELRATWQGGEGTAQVSLGVTVEVPLAPEAARAGEDSQGYDLARTERCLRSWQSFRCAGLAELINRNVKCGEEGVHIEHKSSVPFPSGSVGKPTLVCGHLPLKSSAGNSHQAFKGAQLLANDGRVASALLGGPGFAQVSSGHLGTSDGWTNLKVDFKMNWDYQRPRTAT
jgi:hypothetical protein